MKILCFSRAKKAYQLDALLSEYDSVVMYVARRSKDVHIPIGKVIKKYFSIQDPETFGDWFFYTIASPFLSLYVFCKLAVLRMKGNKTIILTELSDKLLYTSNARILGYRVVWLETHFYPSSFVGNIYSFIFSIFAKLTTVVVTSQSIQKHLVNDIGVNEKHCTNIGTVLDLQTVKEQETIYDNIANFQFQTKNNMLYVIGYIGDLSQDSGVEMLIKAVDSIKEFIIDIQLIIIGDGEQKKNLVWLTKMLGLDSKIRFVGKQESWMRWYNYFDIFVYPLQSKTEFSYQVAYALSHEIPTVVTNVDGVAEVVSYQAGYVIEPGSSAHIAQAILDLHNNKPQSQAFAKQGKKRVHDEYNREVVVKKFRVVITQ